MQEEHEEYEEEKSPIKRFIKKTVIFIVGVFLLILIVSYTAIGGYLFPVIDSLTSSYVLEDYSIVLPDGSRVVFEPEAYEKLKAIYFAEQKYEFKVCLLGRKQGASYIIHGLKVPEMHSQSFSRVVSELCDEETIIPLHSHPRLWCRFSNQDIRSHEAFLRVNPDALVGLMCDTDRFNFYGY